MDWRQISAGYPIKPVSCPVFVLGLPQKKDMCKLFLTVLLLHTNVPVEDKNTNYICIYLRVLRCLCSGTICDILTSSSCHAVSTDIFTPRHFSLSFIASGRSSGLHPVSSHSFCMYVRAGRPAFARPYV